MTTPHTASPQSILETTGSEARRTMAVRRRSPHRQGFTLVEVMLAIGVMAFAILPIVALMPHGLDTLRVSIRQNAESQIQQEILGRLGSADWDSTNDLADFDRSTWYFNDQGAPLQNGTGALYTVQLAVSQTPLPGSANSNYYLRTVVMQITDLPSAVRPFEDPAKYRRYVATLAKMDT